MNETPSMKTSQGSAACEAAAQPAGRRARRMRRINDYRREGLSCPEALAANLTLINADLMVLAAELLGATNRALAHSPTSVEDFPRLMPAVDVCLRVTRQIDRLAQLEGRLRTSAEAERTRVAGGASAPAGSGPVAGAGEETGI